MSDSVPVLGGSVVLGRYRVVRELARGGMGMVYLGRIEGAAGFSKPVVIKRVLSHLDETTDSRAQFIREARLLSELHHPNIVGVIDFGEEEESYLMVLEYVHGFHVGHWLKYAIMTRGSLQWEFSVYVVTRVLSALHYAHTRTGPDGHISPIIHRDVSPGNVLLDLDANVRLLDFGIARATGEIDEAKTQEGVVKGKLPYIAPEMYQSKGASVASDVYAAGVMLYQLLTGKNPFSGKDMASIVSRVLSYTPPPISSIRADVPLELDAVLARALHKDPLSRYPSASAFAQALSELFTRTEADILEQLRLTVNTDFTGQMPQLLRIPALGELDSAWRASSSDPDSEQPLQRSSSLPPDGEDPTAIISPPRLDSLTSSTRNELSIHDQQTAQIDATAVVARAQRLGRRSVPAPEPEPLTRVVTPEFDTAGQPLGSGAHPIGTTTSTKTIVFAMLGAGLLAGGIAAAVLLLGKPSNSSSEGQRFLLVERKDPNTAPAPAASTAVSTTPSPESAPSTEPAPPEPAPTPAPAMRPGPAPSPPTERSQAQALTAAFARRQGAVQNCFKHGQLDGAPQISVRFQVSQTGQVSAANLIPGQLAGTALGQCLLAVARGTQFPATDQGVTFSIPITAQVVKK